MILLRQIAVLFFVLLMNSCTPEPEEAIIGKWQDINFKGQSLTFLKDGTCIMRNANDKSKDFNAKYRFIDKNTIRIENPQGRDKPFAQREVYFKRGRLILTDLANNTYIEHERIE